MVIKPIKNIFPVNLSPRAYKITHIHPFRDGNGRVGRVLANIILIRNGCSPLIVRKTQRISYLSALEDFDSNHDATLDRFFLQRYKETFKKFFGVYVKYL